MIRPFTAICVLLAGSSGLYLYTEKHRTTVLDQQISKIVQDTQHIRERTAMLRAEWALLNQPDRLQALAARFLPGLQPMAPTQFVQMASLAQHLPEIAPEIAKPAPMPAPAAVPAPAPATGPAVASTIAPEQVMARTMVAVEALPERPAQTARAEPEVKRHAPFRVAQADSIAPADAALHAAAAKAHAPIRLASLRPAASRAAEARVGQPRTTPASRMAAYDGGSVHGLVQGAYTYASPAARPASTQAAWRPADAPQGAYGAGSSLGFAHAAVPAPVPVQDNE